MNSVRLIFFRAKKSVFYWVVFAVFGALGIVFATLSATIFRGAVGLSHMLLLPLGMLPFSSESVFSSVSIPPFPFFLLSIGFASVFCGEEYRLGTMKSQVLSGRSRIGVFFSMLLAGLLLAMSLVLAFQVFVTLFSLFLGVPFFLESGVPLGSGGVLKDTMEKGMYVWVFLHSFAILLFAYLSCFVACFAICSAMKNGWAGVVFGGIIFVFLFVVGMIFFTTSSSSLSSDGPKPLPTLVELWFPHFWLRSFFTLSQGCVYEFLGMGEYQTHADYSGYLSLAACTESLALLAASLLFGSMMFRKIDLR